MSQPLPGTVGTDRSISPKVGAAWIVSNLLLLTSALGAISSAASSAFYSWANPSTLAGFILWVALVLGVWSVLAVVLTAVAKFTRPPWTVVARLAPLTVGVATVLICGLRGSAKVTLMPLLGGAFGVGILWLVAIVTAIAAWWLLYWAHQARIGRWQSQVRAMPRGLILLSAYFLAASLLLPGGVNANFTARIWLPLFVLGLWSQVLTVTLAGVPQGWRMQWRNREWHWTDFAFVILPLTPVVAYILGNTTYLTVTSAVTLIGTFLVGLYLLTAVVPTIVSGFANRRVVMAIVSAGLFTLINMASLTRSQAWFETGSFPVQALVLAALMAIAIALSMVPGRALLAIASVFAIVQASVAASSSSEDLHQAEVLSQAESVAGEIDGSSWPMRPDIIVLFYESYANTETMSAYGINNEEQINYLRNERFTEYPGIYSNGSETMQTLPRVLNASTDLGSRSIYLTGDEFVSASLKQQGYSTAGIFSSDFYLGSEFPTWDTVLPQPTGAGPRIPPMAEGILRGEFRVEASFTSIDYDTYLETKREVISKPDSSPLFLFTMNQHPGHSQNSGQCLPDERERYELGLKMANEEMREDIEAINRTRPNAVVVIAGDHGPYLTKNCWSLGTQYPPSEIDRLDIQDRFGTFLAVRWPSGKIPDIDMRVTQDVLPAVLAYASGNSDYWTKRAVSATTIVGNAGPVTVSDGLIIGGKNDGEPLFLERSG